MKCQEVEADLGLPDHEGEVGVEAEANQERGSETTEEDVTEMIRGRGESGIKKGIDPGLEIETETEAATPPVAARVNHLHLLLPPSLQY